MSLQIARKGSYWTRIALTVLSLSAAAWLGTNSAVYRTCEGNVYLAFTLAGFALIHSRLTPKWRDAACLLGTAGLLAFVDLKGLHYPFIGNGVLAVLVFLGFAGILALALGAIWAGGAEGKRFALAFLFAVLSVSFNGLAGIFHNWTARLTPRVWDLYLYCFDASLRVQFAFLMGQIYATTAWFREAGIYIYLGFPLAVATSFAGQLIRNRQILLSAMAAFLIAGPLGVVFYALFPALGPVYLFTSRFPWDPLTLDQALRLNLEGLVIPGLRNAMPSLHMTWVLLAYWYSRGLSVWERAVALTFLLLTMCSTLGSGEHYLIDLVVAFPFALFVYGLCAFSLPLKGRERRTAIGVGLGVALLWLGFLRLIVKVFWLSPVIPWLACIATVVLAWRLQQRAARVAGNMAAAEASSVAIAAAPSRSGA